MQKRFIIFTFFNFVCNSLLVAGAPDNYDKSIMKGKTLIEKGVQKWDEKVLLDARSHFEQFLQNNEMKWLIHYYVGYTDYRLAIYYQVQNNGELQLKYLEDGIVHLQASIKQNKIFADSYALLSSLLGQKSGAYALLEQDKEFADSQGAFAAVVGTDMYLAETLGLRARTALAEALDLGLDNPRVAFFSAMSAYHTPEQYGGSKTWALDEMRRSVELFKKEKRRAQWLPVWGFSEALGWLGRFYFEAGKFDLAKSSLEQALIIDPQNAFAKSVQNLLEQELNGNNQREVGR